MFTGRINQLPFGVPVNACKAFLLIVMLAQFTPAIAHGGNTIGDRFQKERQEIPEIFRQKQTADRTADNSLPEHKVGEVIEQPVVIHRNAPDKNSFWFGVFCGFVIVSAIINILPDRK